MLFKPIQKLCKSVAGRIFFFVYLFSCGSSGPPATQVLLFEDDTVPFQDASCSNQATVVNSSTSSYTLIFLSATFVDKNDKSHSVELDQAQVADRFEPTFIGPGADAEGRVSFNLTDARLAPPLFVTVAIVGLAGDQVVNFVGNFSCE